MQMTIKKQIGDNVLNFIVSGDNLHDCAMEAGKLSFGNVHECGLCKSKKLVLRAHVAQAKYKYTHIDCVECRASLVFGQKKEDANVFYFRRDNDKKLLWEAFKGETDGPPAKEEPPTSEVPPNNGQPTPEVDLVSQAEGESAYMPLLKAFALVKTKEILTEWNKSYKEAITMGVLQESERVILCTMQKTLAKQLMNT